MLEPNGKGDGIETMEAKRCFKPFTLKGNNLGLVVSGSEAFEVVGQ